MVFVRPHRLRRDLPRLRRCAAAAYSLTEMIWVVALIGIIASVAFVQVTQSLGGARLAAAKHKMELLNQGLHAFAMAEREIKASDVAPTSGTSDESLVLLTLQYRNPVSPSPGSPYVEPTYRPRSSSSREDYRLQWSGQLFTLLEPGESGAGLKVPFDGSDFGEPFVYKPNFRPIGN